MLALLALIPSLLSTNALPLTKRYTGAKIQSGRDGQCLTVDDKVEDGDRVISADCSGAKTWDINPGSGSIILSGTSFAIDAGENPGNNGGLKIWTSYPGLYQQT